MFSLGGVSLLEGLSTNSPDQRHVNFMFVCCLPVPQRVAPFPHLPRIQKQTSPFTALTVQINGRSESPAAMAHCGQVRDRSFSQPGSQELTCPGGLRRRLTTTRRNYMVRMEIGEERDGVFVSMISHDPLIATGFLSFSLRLKFHIWYWRLRSSSPWKSAAQLISEIDERVPPHSV
jgi:hypothetical protein